MLKLEWNGLRAGDAVLVHESGPQPTLSDGVVTMVDVHKGVNGVGIRVTSKLGRSVVLWPTYLNVHCVPRDAAEACWQCQNLAVR